MLPVLLQALAQCDSYLRAMPGVVQQAVDDTAGAAQLIAQHQWRYTGPCVCC